MRGRSGWTMEEAELLLESVVGTVKMIPFKFGWIGVPTKTEGTSREDGIIWGRRRIRGTKRRT